MHVGYYQYHPEFGKIQNNLSKVVSALDSTRADLIVLPELAFTGYYFQSREELFDLAEEPNKSTTIKSLHELCKKNNFHIVTGFAERSNDQVFNSSILIGPTGVEHIYRKIHLFNEEKHTFDPGDRPFSIQEINGVKVGMMVCFDWAFPEAMRTLTLMGAQVICHPSNLVLSFCQEAMITRCLENRVFAITTNRYGVDQRPQGELNFTGKSQIVAPGGELLQRAESAQDELFVVEIDPALANNKMITPHNHLLDDRRPEFYLN